MDYKTKKFDDKNTGILFNNTEKWELSKQGKINIDGESHRIIGISRLNKDKEPILDIYRSIGTLKQNQNKQTENHPDSKGVINKISNDGTKIISGWKKVSEQGNQYTSLSLRDFDEVSQVEDEPSEENEINQLSEEEVESIQDNF